MIRSFFIFTFLFLPLISFAQTPILIQKFESHDLAIADAIHIAIKNQLSKFSEIKIYETAELESVDQLLKKDKVQLLAMRRESGFDGMIAGKIETAESTLRLTLRMIDFSAGRIYFNQTIEKSFGAELLRQIENEINAFANALIHYYDSTITVTSDPSESIVKIDGNEIGKTPLISVDVADGDLQIEVSKNGYLPYRQQIAIHRGQRAFLHARLYDQITDHLIHKKSRWTIDAMQFSLATAMQWQKLGEISADAETIVGFRYLSKFGRINLGLDFANGVWIGDQLFDTFVGEETAINEFSIDFVRLGFVGQINLIEKLNQFDLYAGTNIGFTSVNPDQSSAEILIGDLQSVNPTIGGEIGARFYFGSRFVMTAFFGGNLSGEIAFGEKSGNYWGESNYKKRTLDFDHVYAGVTFAYSHWLTGGKQ